MTLSSDNGLPDPRTPTDSVAGEVRINVLIREVDVDARTASAIVGNDIVSNPLELTFAPEVPEDLANLAGKRAWVEGPYERGEDRLLSHIYVEYLEEGSNWMSSAEILARSKSGKARPTKLSVVGFDFDVDEFLELIYVDRGRTWKESKID